MLHPAAFRPAWWLPGPHLQTLWPVLDPFRPRPALRRERLELPDGDFIDLDWLARQGPKGSPRVILLHGLEGSSRSAYARGLLEQVRRRGWRGAVMHFRGTSGEPNRKARSYCAGETADLAWVIRQLHRREPDAPLACVGFSLGGNALLRWLGEQGHRPLPLAAAVAVSVPMLLDRCARRMGRGVSRLYQHHLMRNLKHSYRRKFRHRRDGPVSLAELERLKDFYAFDDRVTAPLHGYRDVHDYYARASSRPVLRHIQVPTLILHALDDPFMSADVVPRNDELSPRTRLELSPRGGHVGFVEGWGRYWLDRRVPAYLAAHLQPD